MTSTYDHRIIQGAESGSFLRRIDQLLQGEEEFYESVAEALGIATSIVTNAYPASALGPAPGRPGAAAAAARPDDASSCRRCRRRPRCSRHTAPTGTSPRASTRSASETRAIPRSTRRTST